MLTLWETATVVHDANKLQQEFVKDHQILTRGFSHIIDAIKDNKWADAVEAAHKLDRDGGPHIAFEESVLYPRVAQSRGDQTVQHLYDEHQTAIEAVQFLLNHPDERQISPEVKARLIDHLQTGLDHAVSCGGLLSYLTILDEQTQSELLKTLQQHRAEGKAMSELARP